MRHIYVHVPFCARRCVYCDFAIAVRRSIPAARYVDAILREFATRRLTDADAEDPATLYIGGGTPSLLPADELDRMVHQLVRGVPAAHCEVTLEANPDDVTERTAAAWVRSGVNRVSLGVQSLNGGALRWMHRTHAVADAAAAVRALRSAGVLNLSIDLIFGLPAHLNVDFAAELAALVELEPEHVSMYGLTVEPRTPLARWVATGSVAACADGEYTEQFLQAHEVLTHAGYQHYEVSNYARPGFRALHNSAYWEGRPYVGLGPSAHSFDGEQRRWNVAPWRDYEQHVAAEGHALEMVETLTVEQANLERVYLGLRTVEGLEAAALDLLNNRVRAKGEREGWLVHGNTGIRLTPDGWLRLDEAVVALTTWS